MYSFSVGKSLWFTKSIGGILNAQTQKNACHIAIAYTRHHTHLLTPGLAQLIKIVGRSIYLPRHSLIARDTVQSMRHSAAVTMYNVWSLMH